LAMAICRAIPAVAGVRVCGLQFDVWGSEFGVWGLGFEVWGLVSLTHPLKQGSGICARPRVRCTAQTPPPMSAAPDASRDNQQPSSPHTTCSRLPHLQHHLTCSIILIWPASLPLLALAMTALPLRCGGRGGGCGVWGVGFGVWGFGIAVCVLPEHRGTRHRGRRPRATRRGLEQQQRRRLLGPVGGWGFEVWGLGLMLCFR